MYYYILWGIQFVNYNINIIIILFLSGTFSRFCVHYLLSFTSLLTWYFIISFVPFTLYISCKCLIWLQILCYTQDLYIICIRISSIIYFCDIFKSIIYYLHAYIPNNAFYHRFLWLYLYKIDVNIYEFVRYIL